MGRTREPEPVETLAEFHERLGGIPMERILMSPPLGTATETDLLQAIREGPRKLIELIDGVLVEKAVGSPQSLLASIILRMLGHHVDAHRLGVLLGPDGMFRLGERLIRMPDVSFLTWARWRTHRDALVTGVAPDLAVEVISPSNTKREMARKVRDLFFAGTRLVWMIYPRTQTGEVYTAPDERRRVPRSGTLTGDPVLPGYRLPLADIFALRDEPQDAGPA